MATAAEYRPGVQSSLLRRVIERVRRRHKHRPVKVDDANPDTDPWGEEISDVLRGIEDLISEQWEDIGEDLDDEA